MKKLMALSCLLLALPLLICITHVPSNAGTYNVTPYDSLNLESLIEDYFGESGWGAVGFMAYHSGGQADDFLKEAFVVFGLGSFTDLIPENNYKFLMIWAFQTNSSTLPPPPLAENGTYQLTWNWNFPSLTTVVKDFSWAPELFGFSVEFDPFDPDYNVIEFNQGINFTDSHTASNVPRYYANPDLDAIYGEGNTPSHLAGHYLAAYTGATGDPYWIGGVFQEENNMNLFGILAEDLEDLPFSINTDNWPADWETGSFLGGIVPTDGGDTVTIIPLPGSVLLLGSGFFGLGLLGFRRRSRD